MKCKALAVVAGSLFALPVFAMPPEDANYAPSVSIMAGKAHDGLVATQSTGETIFNNEAGPGAKHL